MHERTSPRIASWTGDFEYHPAKIVRPETIEDVVRIVSDPDRYPGPVRPMGSNHSTVPVGDPDCGTIIDMRGMNRVIEVGSEEVRVEAGALYIDVAKKLEQHDLQLHQNPVIGNATIGAAVTTGTKDVALPYEFGQISSYARAMTVVTSSGEIREITEDDDPELMRALRCSYGLLGVVVDVTLPVKPLRRVRMCHRNFTFDEFASVFPELARGDEALLFYVFPFIDSVTVESSAPTSETGPPDRVVWAIRAFIYRYAGFTSALLKRILPSVRLRRSLNNLSNRTLRALLGNLIRSRNSMPAARNNRYFDEPGIRRFTFSLWGFPAERYLDILFEYRDFVKEYERNHSYRHDVLTLGFVVPQDDTNILSYSKSGQAVTIDPVATGGEGWEKFCRAFNEFCLDRGGTPLLNQTPQLTHAQVRDAFGDRPDQFVRVREAHDPNGRFLNQHFAELLGLVRVPETAAVDDGN